MIYSHSGLIYLCQVRYHLVNVTLVKTIWNICIFPWYRWRHIPSAEMLIEWKLCAEKSEKSLEKKYFWKFNVTLYDLLVGLCFLQMICRYFRLLLPNATSSDPLRYSIHSIQQQLYVKCLWGGKKKIKLLLIFCYNFFVVVKSPTKLFHFLLLAALNWTHCESLTQFLICFAVKIVL